MARTNTNTGGGGGGVTSVTASLPLTSSGGATPNIAINQPASTRVWYTSNAGVLTGDANFTRNITDDRFTFASNTDTDHGIFYNGTGAPNPLGSFTGLGFDFEGGSRLFILGSSGVGNGTRLEIDDTNAAQSFNVYAKNSISLLVNGADANYIMTDAGAKHVARGAHWQFNDGTADRWFQIKVSAGHKIQYGDYTNDFNSTSVVLDDNAKTITSTINDGLFQVVDTSVNPFLYVNNAAATRTYWLGDGNGTHNGTGIKIADNSSTATVGDIVGNNAKLVVDKSANTMLLDNTAHTTKFGINGTATGNFEVFSSTSEPIFFVDDGAGGIIFAGGDTLLTNNGFRFALFDTLKTLDFASPAGVARFGDIDSSGNGTVVTIDDVLQEVIITRPVRFAAYTVATLPVGATGDIAYVTDALAPTWHAAVVGGGAVITPVFFDNTNWIVI